MPSTALGLPLAGSVYALAITYLVGCGGSQATLVANPSTVDFGAVPAGQTVTKQVTLRNNSSADLMLTFLPPGAADFTNDAGQYFFDSDGWLGGLPATIASHADLTLTLQWTANEDLSQVLEIFYGSANTDFVALTVAGVSAESGP
jgi:hypothetical protein